MSRVARLIGTVGGVGLLRPGPGTWGSAVALPLGWGLHVLGGAPLLAAAVVLGYVAGFWAAREMTRGRAEKDPSEIVIDEVVGQWIALLALSVPAWRMGIDILALWPGWIVAFALFRLFDIWKPGPVGWADRRGGPQGVMLDDVIAGALAALGVVLLAGLSHGVLGL